MHLPRILPRCQGDPRATCVGERVVRGGCDAARIPGTATRMQKDADAVMHAATCVRFHPGLSDCGIASNLFRISVGAFEGHLQ